MGDGSLFYIGGNRKMFKKLECVSIHTKDIERSVSFYTEMEAPDENVFVLVGK
ncbi:hypothetical protein BAC7755_15660 [Bacillus sp. MN7755]